MDEVGQVNGLLLGVLHNGAEKVYEPGELAKLVEGVGASLDDVETEIVKNTKKVEEAAYSLMMMGMLLKISRTLTPMSEMGEPLN